MAINRKSPVINNSDEFVPLQPGQAAAPQDGQPDAPEPTPAGSNVINDSTEFVPMQPPRGAISIDPTNGNIIRGVEAAAAMEQVKDVKRLDSVPFEFADIRALAQRILKRAQEQGQAKIESARKQVEAMERAAYDKAYKEAFPKGQEEGYQKGLKDGLAEANKQIKAAADSEQESLRQNAVPTASVLQELIEALQASRAQLIAQAEGDLLLLAIDLAKRLVGHELSVDREAIRPLAIECIGLVTDRTSITARVNPEDYRVMQDLLPELKVIFADMGALHVMPDETIERGGLVAATREAEVDMRLATRLAAFEDVILGFSGDDAIAPWSSIPADAIAAAKAAGAESQYSFDSLGAGEEPLAPDHPHADPAGIPQDHLQGIPEEMRLEVEQDLAQGMAPPDVDPGVDMSDMGMHDMQDAGLDELAELEGLIDSDPSLQGGAPEGVPADPSEADLAELAALADMAEEEAGGAPAEG